MIDESLTIEQKVTDIIKKIGVPAHLKGYYYAREAILLAIEKEDSRHIANESYQKIADKHGSVANKVQRAIWHCIKIACSRGNEPFINLLFGPGKTETGISNKEFILTIADLVKNRYLEEIVYEDCSML